MNNIEKYGKSEETFDIRPYFESFVLDNILRAFFATIVDSANDPNNPVVINASNVFKKNVTFKQLFAYLSPTIAKWFDIRFVDPKISDFMTELIQNIINQRKQNNIINNDLLQVLLDSTHYKKTSKIRE